MQIYFYALIAVTGCLSIYTDLRQQRIKNKHLLAIAACALVVHATGLFQGKLAISPTLLLSPVAALTIGFMLYACNLWKAGDAKLFLTYSLLMPANKYSSIMPLSCFTLLLNIFLISFLCMLPFLLTTIIGNRAGIIKGVISGETLIGFAKTFLMILGISWVVQPLIIFLPPRDNIFLQFIILYGGYFLLFKYLIKIKYKQLLIIAGILAGFGLRLAFYRQSLTLISALDQIRSLLLYSAVLFTLRGLIRLEQGKSTKSIFAPFMFAGTILAHTNFLWWAMNMLSHLRR